MWDDCGEFCIDTYIPTYTDAATGRDGTGVRSGHFSNTPRSAPSPFSLVPGGVEDRQREAETSSATTCTHAQSPKRVHMYSHARSRGRGLQLPPARLGNGGYAFLPVCPRHWRARRTIGCGRMRGGGHVPKGTHVRPGLMGYIQSGFVPPPRSRAERTLRICAGLATCKSFSTRGMRG